MAPVPRKLRVLGTTVDVTDLSEAIRIVVRWLEENRTSSPSAAPVPCRFVVTPNLDHAVMLRSNPEFRAAYEAAALVLADGMPLVWMSKMLGESLPGRVPGSDLVPGVLAAAPVQTRVYLLGASDESSKTAANNIGSRYPQIKIVGRMSPPFGFERSREWSDEITADIRSSAAELVIVGFGAPKQELWVARHAAQLPNTCVICAGATIDFLSGSVQRAPKWAQKSGVEWVHRMLSDPKRLIRRYARDAAYFPVLVAQDIWDKWHPADASSRGHGDTID